LTGALAAGTVAGAAGAPADSLERGLAELEQLHGGRLGIAVLDMARGRAISHRGNERFAMCSTFKFLAAAFVLARVDRGQESLSRMIVVPRTYLLPNSPVTGAHAGAPGLSMGALCQAAVTRSDNAAANLMLDSFGGPAALTAYLRRLGDPITRLDRHEPEMNYVRPGDMRDTTTPVAMAGLLAKVVLGTALSGASRAQITAWLEAATTGTKRLRAGIPAGWRAGDKTGTVDGVSNDIAVIWPPGRAPIIVTAYYAAPGTADGERDDVLSQVGRLATAL
jgi:beta-lactamase class A